MPYWPACKPVGCLRLILEEGFVLITLSSSWTYLGPRAKGTEAKSIELRVSCVECPVPNVKQVHQRQKGEITSLVGKELGIGQRYSAKSYKYIQIMPFSSLK